MQYIGKFSGGMGSWAAIRRHVDRHGSDNLTLLFTDTLCEDQDAYRFLIAGAANLLGGDAIVPELCDLPQWEDRPVYKRAVLSLARQTMRQLPRLVWLSDGRDPWDVYEHERFLGNSRADPCSKILKRQIADRWLRANCDPKDTQIIVGIDIEEKERFYGDGRKARGLQARMADQGWTFTAPLCELPWWTPARIENRLRAESLWVPRLNKLGFAHNNCGGFCCKGGQGHWKLMLKTFPERYAYAEYREQQIRLMLGDVSMLTDRRGGGLKKPLTLETLRGRDLDAVEASDMGACNCFLGDAA